MSITRSLSTRHTGTSKVADMHYVHGVVTSGLKAAEGRQVVIPLSLSDIVNLLSFAVRTAGAWDDRHGSGAHREVSDETKEARLAIAQAIAAEAKRCPELASVIGSVEDILVTTERTGHLLVAASPATTPRSPTNWRRRRER